MQDWNWSGEPEGVLNGKLFTALAHPMKQKKEPPQHEATPVREELYGNPLKQ